MEMGNFNEERGDYQKEINIAFPWSKASDKSAFLSRIRLKRIFGVSCECLYYVITIYLYTSLSLYSFVLFDLSMSRYYPRMDASLKIMKACYK